MKNNKIFLSILCLLIVFVQLFPMKRKFKECDEDLNNADSMNIDSNTNIRIWSPYFPHLLPRLFVCCREESEDDKEENFKKTENLLKTNPELILQTTVDDESTFTTTVFHLLAQNNNKGHKKIPQLLIDYVKNSKQLFLLNCQDSDGNLPLHYAVKNRNLECVKLFVDNGSRINIANHQGEYPLPSRHHTTGDDYYHGRVIRELHKSEKEMLKILRPTGIDFEYILSKSVTKIDCVHCKQFRGLMEKLIEDKKRETQTEFDAVPALFNDTRSYFYWAPHDLILEIQSFIRNKDIKPKPIIEVKE